MKWLREFARKFTPSPTAWAHPDGTVRFGSCTTVVPRESIPDGGYLNVNGAAYKIRRLPIAGWVD